jgi:GTPase Era involved in 16S rRNA processing
MTVISVPQWPYPLVRQVDAELGNAGLTDLQGRLQAEMAREAKEEATVVVVGETKTGKSSLINALVRSEGLVAVNADVATNIHVLVRFGPTRAMNVYFDGDGSDGTNSKHFDAPDVGSWASVQGNPDNEKGVRAVEVLVNDPLLASGMVLVDTPGVGGIDAAHGRVTLAALTEADALVFVADADRPLIKPELDFLERATERISSVVFVFSKIDIKPGWRKIMEEDQALMAKHAPRFADAPFIGVSSMLETTAAAWERDGKPAAAVQQLRDEAGLNGLREFLLARVADKVHYSRRVTVLRVCQQALDTLEARDHAVTRAGPELLEDLRREESRLGALETAAALWPQRVNDGFVRLRGKLQAQLSDLTKDIGIRYGDKDLEPFVGRPDALREALLREINAIGVELTNGLRSGVEEIETDLIETIAPAGLDVTGADLPTADSIATIEANLVGSPDRFQEGVRVRNVRLGYSAIAQGMSFSGIGHLGFLAVLGISSTSFFGLGLGFGALLAISEARGHRKQAKLQELRPLVGEAQSVCQQKVSLQLGDVMLDVQRRLEAEARRRIKEEQKEAAEARKRCQNMLQAAPEAQEKARADAEAHLAVLEDMRGRCHARLAELEQLVSGAAVLAGAAQ